MIYARTNTRPKQRRSQLKSFAAPLAGWISNRALAVPNGQQGTAPQGASVLDNFIPRSSSVILRRGKLRYCTLGDGGLDALALFSYNNGTNKKLFASTSEAIYDITDVEFAEDVDLVDGGGDVLGAGGGDWFGWSSTEFLDVLTGLTGGDWVVVQFATTGGVYLVGVNATDTGFIYDGTYFYPYVDGGTTALAFDNKVSDFTEGTTVTGGTSGATGVVYRVIGTGLTGTLHFTSVTGTFVDNETLTGGGGSALVNGVAVVVAPGITFPGSLTSADMSYVWVYKNRLFFAEVNTMNAYYLAVDSIGGTANIFPLAGVFGVGGTLLFGHPWSLNSSGDGGLSEQCVFVSSEGEVVAYQGIDPATADTWSRVGVYRIGKPLGKRAFIRGGGDLAIATSIGLVPLSKAVELDATALAVAAVSYSIADAWTDAVELRGLLNWQAEVWPEQKIAVFAPPDIVGASEPVMFIANTETGAWSRFTNWQGLCMEVFQDRLFFGEPGGKVFIANATGLDDGEPYTGAMLPLFDDMGSPASLKVPKMGRVVSRSTAAVNARIDWQGDFNMQFPPAPDATPIEQNSVWDGGTWGTSVWVSALPQVINDNWRSLGGTGYVGAIAYQVTSGSVQPLDDEIIRTEVLYDTAEMIT